MTSRPFIQGQSLIDAATSNYIDAWVVFSEPQIRRSIFWNLLKPGFRHVEFWQKLAEGVWLRLGTGIETIQVQHLSIPPWEAMAHLDATAMRVQLNAPHGRMREPFFIGPVTCVELVKAFLGVRSFFVRTPYQLYKYLKRGQRGKVT